MLNLYKNKLKIFLNAKGWYQLGSSDRYIYAKQIHHQIKSLLEVEELVQRALEINEIRPSVKTNPKINRPYLFQYWHQGIENIPKVVGNAYYSVDLYLSDQFEIIRLDFDNLSKYVTIPEHIVEAVKNKRMSIAHFSDIVRNKLLLEFGGLWLDSTVLISGVKSIELFCLNERVRFQNMPVLINPKYLPNAVGSWMIWSHKRGCRIFAMAEKVIDIYWKENDEINNYFLYHLIITALLRLDNESRNDFDLHKRFYSDSSMDLLYFYMNRKFDRDELYELFERIDIHKLDFKFESYESQIDSLTNFHVLYDKQNFDKYFKSILINLKQLEILN